MAPGGRRARLLLAAFAGTCMALRGAAAAEGGPSEQASELFRLSGLELQLEAMDAQILKGLSAQKGNLPPEVSDALTRSVREAFSPAALKSAVLARISAEIEPQKADRALSWLRSDEGREITKLEQVLSTVEGERGLQAYAKSLPQAPPPQERLGLAQRLDAATGATDLIVDLSLATALAVAVALNATSATPTNPEALNRAVESQRVQLRPALHQVVLVSFLYTYRELPEADLIRYIEFLESEAGAWYHRVTSDAAIGALKSSAMGLAASLARELEKVQPKRSL